MQNAVRHLWLGLVCSAALLAQNTPPGTRVIASTVPANGDVNPYGIAIVPVSVGDLTAGNILISNFNNSSNLQGTGTTIVQITPRGTQSLFAQIDAATLPGACPGGIGLTTALAVLPAGWVVVGSLPTTDGTSATAQAGCLLVLNAKGTVVETIADSSINGPWDMTAVQKGDDAFLFVTNVLNGTVADRGGETGAAVESAIGSGTRAGGGAGESQPGHSGGGAEAGGVSVGGGQIRPAVPAPHPLGGRNGGRESGVRKSSKLTSGKGCFPTRAARRDAADARTVLAVKGSLRRAKIGRALD